MTLISANSIALTILKQPSSAPGVHNTSATDTILEIVSKKTPTTTAADKTSGLATTTGNVGSVAAENSQSSTNIPTVTSAIPRATRSAMDAATRNMMASYYVNPIEYTVENAEWLVRELIRTAAAANPRYLSDTLRNTPEIIVPSRQEYNSQYAEWGAKRIANGEDETLVKKQVDFFTSDWIYEARVTTAALNNSLYEINSETVDRTYSQASRDNMHYGDRALKYFFGSAIVLQFDTNNHVSVTPGTLYHKNGQKMIDYKENGELEIFDMNGILTKKYTQDELV